MNTTTLEFLEKYGALIFIVGLLGFIFLVFALVFGVLLFLRRRRARKVEALMAVGKPGEATVLALEDTGMRINRNPHVIIVLEVRIPNYPPYQVRKTVTIPVIRVPQVQPGSVVSVMADPTQPHNPDMVGLLLK